MLKYILSAFNQAMNSFVLDCNSNGDPNLHGIEERKQEGNVELVDTKEKDLDLSGADCKDITSNGVVSSRLTDGASKKEIVHEKNSVLDGKNIEKSSTILSFDPYGNLLSNNFSDAFYNPNIPLSDFEYIVESFESSFRSDGNIGETSDATKSESGQNKVQKKIRSKRNLSLSSENEGTVEKELLKQAFKRELSCTDAPSRYGRERKQKKEEEDFLFGTLNFNTLRKITGSPLKIKENDTKLEPKEASVKDVCIVNSSQEIIENGSNSLTSAEEVGSQKFFSDIKKCMKKSPRRKSTQKVSTQSPTRNNCEKQNVDEQQIGEEGGKSFRTRSSKKLKGGKTDEKTKNKLFKETSTQDCSIKSLFSKSDTDVVGNLSASPLRRRLRRSASGLSSPQKDATLNQSVCRSVKVEDTPVHKSEVLVGSPKRSCSIESSSMVKSDRGVQNRLRKRSKLSQSGQEIVKRSSPRINSSAKAVGKENSNAGFPEVLPATAGGSTLNGKILSIEKENLTVCGSNNTKMDVVKKDLQASLVSSESDQICDKKDESTLMMGTKVEIGGSDFVVHDNEIPSITSSRQDTSITSVSSKDQCSGEDKNMEEDKSKLKLVDSSTCSFVEGDNKAEDTSTSLLSPQFHAINITTNQEIVRQPLEGSAGIDFLFDPRNEFVVGDLVLSYMKGYPFWPSVVCSTEEGIYKRPKTAAKSTPMFEYNVVFLCDKGRRNWIHSKNLLKFLSKEELKASLQRVKDDIFEKYKPMKKAKVVFERYAKTYQFGTQKMDSTQCARWHVAMEEAEQLTELDGRQRIEKCFPRKEKKIETKNSLSKRKRSLSENDTFQEPTAKKVKVERDELEKDVENKKLKEHEASDSAASFRLFLRIKLKKLLKKNESMSRYRARQLLFSKWKKMSDEDRKKYVKKSKSLVQCVAKKENDEVEKDNKGIYRIPRNEKVCVQCESASANYGQDMVKCRGVCNSFYHIVCAGLKERPEVDFKCSNCVSGTHCCFVCKSSTENVVKCSMNLCGKFYHLSCLDKWPQKIKNARNSDKFVCPRHLCHTCAAIADDMNDGKARTAPFTRCLQCPTTYHTSNLCIAAGVTEVTQHAHVCTKHMPKIGNTLTHVNVNWCFLCSKGGSLILCDECPAAFHADCMNISAPEGGYICEDCEVGKYPLYGDIVWVKVGNHRWWPGQVLHPKYIPDNIDNLPRLQGMFCVHFFGSDDYYWVSRGRAFHYQEGDQGSKSSSNKGIEVKFRKALEEAVVAYVGQMELRDQQTRKFKNNAKPQAYCRIESNKPVPPVKLGKVDYSTVNKCDCDPFLEAPCSSDDKCLNRMLMVECLKEVCSAGEKCKNQRFQKKEYPSVVPYNTSSTGWGLKTNEDIKKGDFVIEYVGELIDDTELRRRLEQMQKEKQDNYYFLTIHNDKIIDAGPKGNLARFMNHSCEPNCVTQKWTVGAETRVGLFALHDIPSGSGLTFNYNLECIGTEKKRCHCDSKNCSGFIGVKVQKPALGAVKNEKRKKKRRKRNTTMPEDECFRCGMAGDLLLCDSLNCPKGYHLACLNLKDVPRGKWICPWHHCDDCGQRASAKCLLCPNSWCHRHVSDNFYNIPGVENLCTDHEACEYDAPSTGSDGTGSTSSTLSSRSGSPESGS